MTPAISFNQILDLRGRIVIFTPHAQEGVRLEKVAERNHAQVICTRGWADPYGPLAMWDRICAAGEYGVLSCDQHRYVVGMKIRCTDIVWVGETGDPVKDWPLWARFSQAMARSIHDELPPRLWLLALGA